MDNKLGKSPYFTTKPSFGITLSQPTKKKSNNTYWKDIKLDSYLDFNCRKPKLKWSLAKYDSIQTQISCTNSLTLTVGSIPISGQTAIGKPILSTGKST